MSMIWDLDVLSGFHPMFMSGSLEYPSFFINSKNLVLVNKLFNCRFSVKCWMIFAPYKIVLSEQIHETENGFD